MGILSAEVSIGSFDQRHWLELSATINTDAFLISMPSSTLRSIGVAPSFTENVRTADGRTRTLDVGHVWLRTNGREAITLVAFNDDYTSPVVGSLALGTLRMGVDLVGQQLVPLDGIPL